MGDLGNGKEMFLFMNLEFFFAWLNVASYGNFGESVENLQNSK